MKYPTWRVTVHIIGSADTEVGKQRILGYGSSWNGLQGWKTPFLQHLLHIWEKLHEGFIDLTSVYLAGEVNIHQMRWSKPVADKHWAKGWCHCSSQLPIKAGCSKKQSHHIGEILFRSMLCFKVQQYTNIGLSDSDKRNPLIYKNS